MLSGSTEQTAKSNQPGRGRRGRPRAGERPLCGHICRVAESHKKWPFFVLRDAAYVSAQGAFPRPASSNLSLPQLPDKCRRLISSTQLRL